MPDGKRPHHPPAYRIRTAIQPGDLGAIVNLHGVLYAEEYGFDHTFEPYVAAPMAEFVLGGGEGGRLWVVESGSRVAGSVAVVRVSAAAAQLRWLILHPDLRGCGLGRTLVENAVSFAESAGYGTLFLWTLDILPAALKLYTSAGFRLTEKKAHRIWGRHLTEERYDLSLPRAGAGS